MEDALLLSQMEMLSKLMTVPVSVYQQTSCLKHFAPYLTTFDMVSPWIHLLGEDEGQPKAALTDDFLLFGSVPDETTGKTIYLGPVRTGKIDERGIRRIIASGSPSLQDSDLQEIMLYLNACASWSVQRFSFLLNLVYSFRNHRPADLPADTSLREVRRAFHSTGDILPQDQDESADYEKRILFYIRHGMTDSLRRIGTYMGDVPALASGTLRMYQNALIILNSLCQRAAISGGLEPEISYRIGLVYIRKIEACASVAELVHLNQNMQMAVDYSERVAQIIWPGTSDPNIQKAVRYIRQNYQKRITVEEIADVVHLSKEYLSSRFHAETGMTIPHYISRQKIVAAQELLTFTEMTIAETAGFLSFSSQSYFQSVFKKIVGITPLEFRQKSKYDSLISLPQPPVALPGKRRRLS